MNGRGSVTFGTGALGASGGVNARKGVVPKVTQPPARAALQTALPGLGPDVRDPFRFTWWNTPEGARVWIEHRGVWRPGVIVGRGRKYVTVEIAGAGKRRGSVRKLYPQLRRRG